MTDWTDSTITSTSWNSRTYNTSSSVLYNSPISYNADYITYNGYYIGTETDWQGTAAFQTSWRSS